MAGSLAARSTPRKLPSSLPTVLLPAPPLPPIPATQACPSFFSPRRPLHYPLMLRLSISSISGAGPTRYPLRRSNTPLFGGVKVEMRRRGVFPRGGGQVTLRVDPMPIGTMLTPAVVEERGDVVRIHGYIFVSGGMPLPMVQDMRQMALILLRAAGYGHIKTLEQDIQVEKDKAKLGAGAGLSSGRRRARGVSLLGVRGIRANLMHGGCVDGHLQDQLIIFMALAKGKSRIVTGPVTLHTRTAIHVAEQLTQAKFTVHNLDGNRHAIECEGIGFCVDGAVVMEEGEMGGTLPLILRN